MTNSLLFLFTNSVTDNLKVVESKSLKKAGLLLFLNKTDLLEKKLAQGIMLRHSLASFGDRKNDLPTILKCACLHTSLRRVCLTELCSLQDLKRKFRETFMAAASQSPSNRAFYIFPTSMTVSLIHSFIKVLFNWDCADRMCKKRQLH